MQREQHRIAAESDSPSEALARPKWDTPFNRALNILKRLPVETRPSYGRVHGVGDGATWKKYYRETTEERKERRRLTEENIDKKVEIAVEKKSSQTVATAVAAAKQVVADLSTSLVTGVFTWTRQNPEKMQRTFPLLTSWEHLLPHRLPHLLPHRLPHRTCSVVLRLWLSSTPSRYLSHRPPSI